MKGSIMMQEAHNNMHNKALLLLMQDEKGSDNVHEARVHGSEDRVQELEQERQREQDVPEQRDDEISKSSKDERTSCSTTELRSDVDSKQEIGEKATIDQRESKSMQVSEEVEVDQSNVGPRERLKRHRREVAGHVWIPDMWGQERFLNDWIDCTSFDASLVRQNIMLARASLMQKPATRPLENNC